MKRFPPWIRKTIREHEDCGRTKQLLHERNVQTVCEYSLCPNLNECYGRKFVTFQILGGACTRSCAFCATDKTKKRFPVDEDEPKRIADAAVALCLRFVVVTSVTRDDLPDGGARQFARVVRLLRQQNAGCAVELLTPDFNGSKASVSTVVLSMPDVLAHNIETVPRLYGLVRPGASYERSLFVLRYAKRLRPSLVTKSSLMVGLGEERNEVLRVLREIRGTGCESVTIGQYLQPGKQLLPVDRFVTPGEFNFYRESAYDIGFKHVKAGPFVRSSYFAEEISESLLKKPQVTE